MKIFTLAFFALFVALSTYAQDSIPNGGFEHWTRGGANYFDPDGWRTANPYTSAAGVVCVNQDSATQHSGSYCANLTTKAVAGQLAPGTLTTGSIDVATFSIVGGLPVSSRPLSVQGWYQYTPSGSDTGLVSVTLWTTSIASPLGTGSMDMHTAATWTYFNVPITYTSGGTPDTAQVIIVSSGYHGTAGSVMLVDDVSYSYTSGINENNMIQVKTYPNPVTDVEFFHLDEAVELQQSSIAFFDATGRQVKQVEVTNHSFQVDTRNLATGVYTYRLVNNGTVAGTGKINVQR